MAWHSKSDLVEAVDLGLMLLQTLGEKMSRQLTTISELVAEDHADLLVDALRNAGMFDVGTTV
jgi:hypothetical protein